MSTNETVNSIIATIDKSILLGAAFDCMSESGKQKFIDKLTKIINEHSINETSN